MSDIIFAQGLIVKDAAPEYVRAKLSFKSEEFIQFLKDHDKNGWVNVEVKVSKGGKLYAQLDTWEPNTKSVEPNEEPQADNKGFSDDEEDDLIF